eukprot:2575824-Pleurochrysis_carterae.AAC.5
MPFAARDPPWGVHTTRAHTAHHACLLVRFQHALCHYVSPFPGCQDAQHRNAQEHDSTLHVRVYPLVCVETCDSASSNSAEYSVRWVRQLSSKARISACSDDIHGTLTL